MKEKKENKINDEGIEVGDKVLIEVKVTGIKNGNADIELPITKNIGTCFLPSNDTRKILKIFNIPLTSLKLSSTDEHSE